MEPVSCLGATLALESLTARAPKTEGQVALRIVNHDRRSVAVRNGQRASDHRYPREPPLTLTDSPRQRNTLPDAETPMAPALRDMVRGQATGEPPGNHLGPSG